MRLSHRMLTIAVLLVGGLMALSEAPEILTLTDNVSNDCESVQVAGQSRQRCLVEDSTGKVSHGRVLSSGDRGSAQSFLSSPSLESSRSLLLLLVTQRK